MVAAGAAVCLLLVGCGAPPPPAPPDMPPAARARVTRLAKLAANGAGWVPCGAAHAVTTDDGTTVDAQGAAMRVTCDGEPPRALALRRADLDRDGQIDLVSALSRDGRLQWRRRTGPCAYAAPVDLAPAAPGVARNVQVHEGEIIAGIAEAPAPARILRRDGMGWREVPVAVRGMSPPRGWPVWFVCRWSGALFFGIDRGLGWIEPDAPIAPRFAAADPMGAAEVNVSGEPRLFVAGLPGQSMLLAARAGVLTDTADAAVKGPPLTVTWGAHAVDLDGDGADDVIALALTGTNADDGRPRVPRVLVQRAGAFVEASVEGHVLYAFYLDCIGATCVGWSGGGTEAQTFRVEAL